MRVTLLLALGWSAVAGNAFADTGTVMPAVFEQGMVFLEVPAPDHSTLRLFTDSGAGLPTLSTEAVRRLQLATRATADEELLRGFGPNVRLTKASKYMQFQWPVLRATESFVVVPGVVAFKGWPATADGTLGASWFAHHTWTWNYPLGKLILRPQHWRPADDAREFAIAFHTDARGRHAFHYARMMIGVDGAEIPVLFDTGAHTVLTPAALQALGDGKPAMRSTSMITRSVFEAWHSRHADWRVVDDAQLATHSRMILVPNVTVAGHSAGPVWFTERDDENFHGMMSSLMSGVVEGAIGGNVFAGFLISVDYPGSRAWLQSNSAIRTSTQ
jgi:hypothetical protein